MQYIVHILTFPQRFKKGFRSIFEQTKICMSPLNFYKTVLKKVSFSKTLFAKEYNKAMQELSQEDKLVLMHWVAIHFDQMDCILAEQY